MNGDIMSLYGEYLEVKSELISKDFKFKQAVEKWFDETPKVILVQPLALADSLTIDHFTITATSEFQNHLQDFEEAFEVKCVRINHNEIIIPEECVDDIWKFHFREMK